MLMNRIFSICLLLIALCANAQNKKFTINGSIDGAGYNGKYIYLQKMSDDRRSLVKIDSALIQNNEFVFSDLSRTEGVELGFVSSPQLKDAHQALVVLESGIIDLKMGKPSFASGTPGNEACYRFIQDQELQKTKLEALLQKTEYLDSEEGTAEYDALLNTIKTNGFEYTKSNIGNEVGEFFLFSFIELFEPSDILDLLSETRPQFQNSRMGSEMKAYFEKKAKTGKGAKFMDFSMPAPDGRQISLSDYAGKGKIILVDFWASWCGPCIKEMPHVVKAYNEYRDKGFEIVGVSFDTDASAWKGALSRLNMTWPQMSDLKGWKSEAGQLYGITSIPFTMLLDREGTIIATNLRGEQLSNKLKELLD